jgi:hopanoid biosynthesis associated RND transporter like protein HpnN
MSVKPEPEESPFFRRLLVRLVSAVCRFPRLVLILALACCAASLFASSQFLNYRTERSDLVNPHKVYQQRWQQYVKEFGDDDDIVVVVQGTDRPQMERALEALAHEIGQQTQLFDRLFYKVNLMPLHRRALLFLPSEQIQQIQENLGSMKLLLEFGPIGWKSLTLHRMLREARHRAGAIQPGEQLRPSDDQFLTQLLSISRTATATLASPANYRNPWTSLLVQPPDQKDLLAEPQYFFSGDNSLAFLLTRPVKEAGSFTGSKKGVDAMRAVVAEVGEQFPDLRLGLTGLPVLETDEMVAAQRDTHVASILAILGVTILFFIVYRSLYYPLLTVGTLLIGTSWALGWTTLTVGHLNILSATFAVMLVGMGDYGVLWVMRYERERRMGADVETALRHTAVCVGAGTLTAAAATALAFYAAMLADFQGVAELGWIAGSGVILCALSCFTVLPALLKLFDRRSFTGEVGRGSKSEPFHQPMMDGLLRPRFSILDLQSSTFFGGEWLPGLAGRSKIVITASLAVVIVLGLCATRVTYDHNLLHLQARGLDSVKWELTLIDHTAGASWHALSYTTSPEEALALKARYEKLPEVSRVVEVASLVPRDQDYKLGLLRDIQNRLRYLPEAAALPEHSRPNSRELKTELTCLIGQLQPLADSCPQPLLSDLRRSLTALHDRLGEIPTAVTAEEHLQNFEEKMVADLAADLRQLRDVSNPEKISVADLPSALRERYIGRTGKWLLQVYGKECLWDFGPLENFAKQIKTVDPEATGKPFGTVEGLRSMKNGFLWAGLYAFCAIVVVLLIDFRNIAHMLVALAPLAMGVTLALGIMGLVGLPLNPANMIALPLILGVGVDNGVHLLHDFLAVKREGRRILSRAIGRGVLVKALTAMIGFGTLMISSQRGLAGLGLCLALGMACCMMTALVFLPSVLRTCRDQETTTSTSADPPTCRLAA